MEKSSSDWSGIHGDVLGCILDKVASLGDYFRCGAVCASWQAAFTAGLEQRKSRRSLPLLLVPPIKVLDKLDDRIVPVDVDKEVVYADPNGTRSLYSLTLQKEIPGVEVNVPHNKHCIGSSFGWLVTMQRTGYMEYSLQLRNPFLSKTINLPFLDDIIERKDEIAQYIQKVVLSANPFFGKFVAVAIVGLNYVLACLLPGNTVWTPIQVQLKGIQEWNVHIRDVIYYTKAQAFYAVTAHTGAVLALDLNGEEAPKMTQVAPPVKIDRVSLRFLVESSSSGDLLQVLRTQPGSYKVVKLDPSTKDGWVQIHNLDGNALFIGSNSSPSLCASHFPGCKPNCIYYTHCPWYGNSGLWLYKSTDNGVFDLENKPLNHITHLSPISSQLDQYGSKLLEG